MKKLFFLSIFFIFLSQEGKANIFDNLRNQGPEKNDIYTYIDKTTKFLNTEWDNDEDLKDVLRPPQILPIAADSKVYGGCGDYSIGAEVGGSAYCPRTHTIFLVPEQLQYFANEFGPSAVAFVVAHEYAHAVQLAFGILGTLKDPALELQADCIAGIFTSSMLNISRSEMLSLARLSLHLGSDDHGTGSQRAYALLTGLGVIEGTCFDKDITKLAKGKIKNKRIMRILSSRSGLGSIDIEKTPYPKTLLHVLNPI